MIRVLVVDDSPFIRHTVADMLRSDPRLEVVGTARSGADALLQVAELNPDVVTVDLNMPDMSGAEFLRRQGQVRAVRAIVLTASAEDEPLAAEAVEAGALEFVRKPGALANDRLLAVRDELVSKVVAVAEISLDRLRARWRPLNPSTWRSNSKAGERLVLLGLSTGGPHHLRQLLAQFVEPLPALMAGVIHMPAGFTAPFARRLNELGPQRVVEATRTTRLEIGRLVLAPAGVHLRVEGGGELSLKPGVPDELHVPSVDELFRSGADAFGMRCLAVVFTGMGRDGTVGASWVKAAGGRVLAEAESSCVVYGMPRSVVEAGLADEVVPLDGMLDRISAWLDT